MTDAECAGEINTSSEKVLKKILVLSLYAGNRQISWQLNYDAHSKNFPPLCGSEGCAADVSVMDVKGTCQKCTEMRFLMSEGCQLINLHLESMFPIIDDGNQF